MENKGNTLAKVALGINVILIIAVIILFAKMPSNGGEEVAVSDDSTDQTMATVPDDGQFRVGFFMADSLNTQWLFMKDLETEIGKLQLEGENKMKAKEREIQKWQKKWENMGTLLPDEQLKFQQEAAQKEQEFAIFQQNLQMDLAMRQENLMLTAIQRITVASKEYAEREGFDYIISYQVGQKYLLWFSKL